MTADALVRTGPVRSASPPPEARGLARDAVRLLVARPGSVQHARFRDLAGFLEPGDLVVVNTSATLAAAVDGRGRQGQVTVHLSSELPDGTWAVELRPGRRADGPLPGVAVGDTVATSRLWQARLVVPGPVPAYLARHGRPIAYSYVPDDWPIACYQTVFGREPGSAEMPSAGRPFSDAVVTDLVTAGVSLAPVTLHAGVSSQEAGEPPLPEPFRVPAGTAHLVQHTRRLGGRVVAVGTTVTRALETAAAEDGTVRPAEGWTDLVLGPERPARVVDGLVTGWHEPGASHLRLLEAVAGRELVASAYDAAYTAGYLWHELGDSALLLP